MEQTNPNLIQHDFEKSLVYTCLLNMASKQTSKIQRLKEIANCEQVQFRLAVAEDAIEHYSQALIGIAKRAAIKPVSLDVFNTSVVAGVKSYLVDSTKSSDQDCPELVDVYHLSLIHI